MKRSLSFALVLVAALASGASAQASAQAAPRPTSKSAKAAAPAPAKASTPLPVDTAPKVLINREVFQYEGSGRRDPFISLLTTSDLRPLLTELCCGFA
jgi:hypothetical protein